MIFRKTIGVGLLGSLAMAAVAAEPSLDSARRCGAIADNSSRLECFDKLFRATPDKVNASASAASAASAAAAAFGDEALKKSTAERAAAEATKPSELTARVAGLQEISEKRYRVTLDNGQVWQQEETQVKTMPEVAVGDTVRVQKRSLGSYFMATVRNGKDTNWLRVSRQK